VFANNNPDCTQFLKLKLEIYLGVRELAEKIHALGPELLFLCGPAFYCSAEFCDAGLRQPTKPRVNIIPRYAPIFDWTLLSLFTVDGIAKPFK
jgi:hypothetical protein